jgi:signal transduction histidine kinase
LLRSPQDVAVLSGPPWWTWRKIAMLVGTLLTILGVTLLWVHLLHRRLERQQAAQLAFSRHVLERLENERRRIAVNLHDSLGQTLMVIKNHAILAIDRPPEEPGLRNRLEEISGATSQAIEEVRRITHGLRPYQLDRLGLTQAVRALTDRASRHNSILFASRINDIDDLFDKDSEIHVYRIVQEAITNVVKHSAATEATVVVKKWPSVVSLSIRDNGRGFDPAKQSAQRHDLGYGLSGITERVRILKGTLAIDSKPGEGTSLTVEVPIPNPRL